MRALRFGKNRFIRRACPVSHAMLYEPRRALTRPSVGRSSCTAFNIGTVSWISGFRRPFRPRGAYVVGLESTLAGTVNVQFNHGFCEFVIIGGFEPGRGGILLRIQS